MGTTLTALQAGSTAWCYSVAIEGYSRILTNCQSTTAMADAWAGTDWSSALGGLYIELDIEQRIDPWNPWANDGGTCVIKVVPDAADTFGIDVFKKNAGFKTQLTDTLGRTGTTIDVKNTNNFDSSGTMYLGTEAIFFGGKTSTSFTGCTRAQYSPFGTDGGTGGDRFGQWHRVGPTSTDGPKFEATISTIPRVWIGKLVAVYIHRLVDGVPDDMDQAHRVFAGRIAEIRDDPQSMGTVIELKHVLSTMKEATVGRELWQATCPEGFYLKAGMRASIKDTTEYHVNTFDSADDFVVVASGATAPNEVDEGQYTLEELLTFLSNWLASETAAGNINGSYAFGLVLDTDAGPRVPFYWRIPGATGSGPGRVEFRCSVVMARAMGFVKDIGATSGNIDSLGEITLEGDNDYHTQFGDAEPCRSVFVRLGAGSGGNLSITIENEVGTFFDNIDYLPSTGFDVGGNIPANLGVFILNDTVPFTASHNSGYLGNVTTNWLDYKTVTGQQGSFLDQYFVIPWSAETGTATVRQVLVLEESFSNLLQYFLYSTGTAGYNEPDFDVFPFGIGIGIPGGLITSIADSINTLAGSDNSVVTIIDKPTKFADIFEPELKLRWAFPRWKNGLIEFSQWVPPIATAAVADLTEGTKAAPAGNIDNHLTSTALTDVFQRPIVTVAYNRSIFEQSKNSEYTSSITFEDMVAVDDAGGVGEAITIKARNTYSQYTNTGAGIRGIAPDFLANLPLFSRPASFMTRSIDPRYFWSLSVGDVVTLSDEFARDPATGRRGIGQRAAIITRHRFNPGGMQPGSREPMPPGGEVDLFFLEVSRSSVYGPGAIVDDTATNAGYNAGTKTLTCYAHKCSESGEAADATNFPAGYKVTIIERDPADPTSPIVWDDTVVSQTGNTIVLTAGPPSGWDNTKFYRVMFADYANALTAQQTGFSYQADDADGQVVDSASPYEYGAILPTGAWSDPSLSDEVELPPDQIYGEGESRDVGHDRALAQLLNNLVDVKTNKFFPQLGDIVSGTVGGSMLITHAFPVFLDPIPFGFSNRRALKVAPFMASGDGGPVTVRVTLTDRPPWEGDSIDHTRPNAYSSYDFTTSSTTWATATAQDLLIGNYKDANGVAWIWIECSFQGQTRGLAVCQEGETV